ncbi:MAG: hypothetical protein BWY83_00943 [bacterium ADurb.Bin478]|nr:MAG: hypothetical protein BWY83_00943 [bacterium ADurb.Bin478]
MDGLSLRSDLFTVRSHNGGYQHQIDVLLTVVGHLGCHPNLRLTPGNLRRSNKGAPGTNMEGCSGDEPHMAVNAGARVPARVRLLRVVHLHRQHVFACAHMPGQVVVKSGIPIGPAAQRLSVDVDCAVLVDPVEDDIKFFILHGGELELFSVPGDAAGQQAALMAGGMLGFERAFNAPVMGHVQTSPALVGKRGLLGARCVAEMKLPIAVEIFSSDRLREQLCVSCADQRRDGQDSEPHFFSSSFNGNLLCNRASLQ